MGDALLDWTFFRHKSLQGSGSTTHLHLIEKKNDLHSYPLCEWECIRIFDIFVIYLNLLKDIIV